MVRRSVLRQETLADDRRRLRDRRKVGASCNADPAASRPRRRPASSPPPTPTPTPTPVPTPLGLFHDGAVKRLRVRPPAPSPGVPDNGTVTVVAGNAQGDHADTVGIYLALLPPGGTSNFGGCSPAGVLNLGSLTLLPGDYVTLKTQPNWQCANPGAVDGMSWTLKAVADVHGDDFASCSTLVADVQRRVRRGPGERRQRRLQQFQHTPAPRSGSDRSIVPREERDEDTKTDRFARLLRLAILAALPAIALAAILATGNLTSRAVQNAVISIDMVTTGNSYDEVRRDSDGFPTREQTHMTVGTIDNCLTTAAPGNNITHTHTTHLIIQNVEDLIAWQIRLNYLGDQMRPSTFNATPFTDSITGDSVGFVNLPIDSASGHHRGVVPASNIPAAAPGPQTALIGAVYNGAQNFPVSPDTPAKGRPTTSPTDLQHHRRRYPRHLDPPGARGQRRQRLPLHEPRRRQPQPAREQLHVLQRHRYHDSPHSRHPAR